MIAAMTFRPHHSPRRRATLRCEAAFAVLAFLFSGCYGDFGRPRQTVVSNDRAYWLSAQAAVAAGVLPSTYPFTDEEQLLRELAYALIRPPYSRQRWYFFLGEFRRTSVIPYYGEIVDYGAYARKILGLPARSPTARYQQLIDAVRNDLFGIEQFLPVASQVAGFDRKREQSLAFVTNLTIDEDANARARVAENGAILAWVQKCLGERAAAYRFVLERLVIGTPSQRALEAERVLTGLDTRIANMYAGWAAVPAVAAPGAGPAIVTK